MTIEERLESLEQELVRTKRNNRRMMIALTAVISIGLLAILMGGATAEEQSKIYPEIRANKFVLVNEKGNDRILLNVVQDIPALALYDENNKPRVVLQASSVHGPGIDILDENNNIRAAMIVTEDVPSLNLWGEKGKFRTSLSISKDGHGLYLYDENDNNLVQLSMGKEENGLFVFDENHKGGIKLTVEKDVRRLALFDENGKGRTGLCTTKKGPFFTMDDENGNNRILLKTHEPGSSLQLCDETGKVRAVFGSGETVLPDGKTIKYSESSIRLCGPDGKIIWEVPQ